MPNEQWDNGGPAANSGYNQGSLTATSAQAHTSVLGPRFNAIVAFFPFLEAQAVFDNFVTNNHQPWEGGSFPPGAVSILHCPSDRNTLRSGRGGGTTSMSNIALSLGDNITVVGNTRGIATWPFPNPLRSASTLAERRSQVNEIAGVGMDAIHDGTSNSIFCSEIVVATDQTYMNAKGGISQSGTFGAGGGSAIGNWTFNTSLCMSNALTDDRREVRSGQGFGGGGRGRRPLDRWINYGWVFNTLLPPNGPVCMREGAEQAGSGALTAQSFHSGGVNVGMADGAVRFVTDSVNTNNAGGGMIQLGTSGHPAFSGPSNFGVWGAMGSINGGESVSL